MINAAIVGIGLWGKSIVEAVQGRSNQLRFTRGVSRTPEALADFSRAHGIKLSTDFNEVLADPDIDAVVLATPHSLHADQVVAAASAGKHVFCEKPLALTRADAVRAVQACERANRVLGIGENKRFWASMVELRNIVASGRLGKILHIEGHSSNEKSSNFSAWREAPEETPAGGMTGAGTKIIDALISIAGPIATLTAQQTTRRVGVDPLDTVSVMFELENGVSATLSTVRATPLYWRFHVFGDQGSAEVLSETDLVIRQQSGLVERKTVPAFNSICAEFDAFAVAIVSEISFPIKPCEMIETTAALEAIVQSVATKQTVSMNSFFAARLRARIESGVTNSCQ